MDATLEKELEEILDRDKNRGEVDFQDDDKYDSPNGTVILMVISNIAMYALGLWYLWEVFFNGGFKW